MSDRRIFDGSRFGEGAGQRIGKGRYVVRMDTATADRVLGSPSAAGFSPASGGVPLADVRGGRGRLSFGAGSERFAAARDMGMRTVPVAMTLAAARKAHKQGLLVGGPGVTNDRRLDRRSAGAMFIQIDLTDMTRLAQQLNGTSVAIEKGHVVISRAINYGMRKFQTGLGRSLKDWTGIRAMERLKRGFRTKYSTPALMHAVLNVRDRHIRVTDEYFGAKWSRANPGATHSAWGRPQLAVGSFMIPGKKPVFKREGKARKPIAPLWGPSVPREIERHRGEVDAQLAVVGAAVGREATALMRLAITGSRR